MRPANNLYIVHESAIGLQFAASAGSPPFGIKMVLLSFHLSGMRCAFRHILNICVRTLASLSNSRRWLYVNLSPPGAVLSLDFSLRLTSSTVKGAYEGGLGAFIASLYILRSGWTVGVLKNFSASAAWGTLHWLFASRNS